MAAGKKFSLCVFSLGFAAILAQVILFRELLALSLGNEMSVGLIFCGWLAGVSLGSAVGGIVSARSRISPWHVAAALIALPAILPADIYLVRALRPMAGFIQGEIVPFGALCWMIPLTLAPVAALVGLSFVWMCSIAGAVDIQEEARSNNRALQTAPQTKINAGRGHPSAPALAPARVYMLEAAGSLAGSILYCLRLVILFSPMTISALMLACAGGALAIWSKGALRWFSLATIAAAVIFLIAASGPLDDASRAAQWRGQAVDSVQESPYANLTAIKAKGQVSLFSNGRLAGTVPETVSAEFAAHVPLSLHGNPKEILVIGDGPAVVREALKHGAPRVTVVEADPVMIGLRERYLPLDDVNLMRDTARVEQVITDARHFIFTTARKFDVILLQAGEPDTLLVNRYYTAEFYKAVRERLNPGGIFSMPAPFNEGSMSDWQVDLLGTQLKTLATSFPQRPLLVPGLQMSLLISSRDNSLEYGPGPAIANYLKRGVKAEHFGPEILLDVLDQSKIEQVLQQPRLTGPDLGAYIVQPDKIGYVFNRIETRPGAMVNTDFHPVSTYYQMRVSSEYYPGALKQFFEKAGGRRVELPAIIIAGALGALMLVLRLSGKAGGAATAAPAVAAAGFAGMAIEVTAIFIFQTLNGNIYYFIGIIIGAFMAGGAAGGWLAKKIVQRGGKAVSLGSALCSLALAGVCAGAARMLAPLEQQGGGADATMALLFLMLAAGALVGMIYTLAAASGANRSGTGWLYAADHLGAAAGGLAAGMIFVPLIGVKSTMLMCAWVVLLCALPLIEIRKPVEKQEKQGQTPLT